MTSDPLIFWGYSHPPHTTIIYVESEERARACAFAGGKVWKRVETVTLEEVEK